MFSKASSDFYNVIGGKFLKDAKKYIIAHNLYKYKLTNYNKYIDEESLKKLAELPCSRTQGNLDQKNIKISKMMRNYTGVSEKTACDQCDKQAFCKVAFTPTKVKPTTAEFIRFIFMVSQDPPKTAENQEAFSKLALSVDKFVGQLPFIPIPLKTLKPKFTGKVQDNEDERKLKESLGLSDAKIDEIASKHQASKDDTKEETIEKIIEINKIIKRANEDEDENENEPTGSIRASPVKKRAIKKKLRISKKHFWVPQDADIARNQKKEARNLRRSQESTIDAIIKRNAELVVTKNKKHKIKKPKKVDKKRRFSTPAKKTK